MRGAGHVEEKPIAAPAGPIARLLPGCQQNVLRHARSILYFSKDLPCRCGLGNLAQRNDRREVRETVFPETCSRPPASEAIYRKGDFAGTTQDRFWVDGMRRSTPIGASAKLA